jgi:GNAT superfamily N-acetyltransferase
MSTQGFQIELIEVDPQDARLLNEVIALGDRSRRTLGFLPRPAFAQAAECGTLLAAVHDEHVVGYALYLLPRQVVRLTHLCVSEHVRGQGVARLLVDAISERHADRFGITLKCRKDFAANGLWSHLGFELQGEVRGRSRRGLPLSVWWRDHGHPNLFSATESIGLLRVALDHNVFLDLELSAGRHGASESQALAEDWLADQVELVVTTELARELARLPEGPDKSRQHRAAARYRKLVIDSSAASALARNITDHVMATQRLDLSVDPSDVSDVRHVAEASLAGVTVLASRDEKLLKWSGQAADVTGVRVMRPEDVILQVDELAHAQAYRPVQLQDTRYRLTPVRAGAEEELLTFLHKSDGEQKAPYLNQIRRIIAGGRQWTRTILRNPDGKPIAFYATGGSDDELIVPVFRVAASRLEETVTRQLLFLVRDQAQRAGQSIVRITEPGLTRETQRIIREDGFINLSDSWLCLVIRACGAAAVVDALAVAAADRAGLRMPTLRPGLSSVIAADLERTLWPAKITDSALPTYLIAINPTWSAELFGIPQTLMPRPNMIGLSREHVYYRSPRPRTPAPARLLWYVTDPKRGGGVAAVIGCSRLDETVVGKPAALFQRFSHLGVWERKQVTNAAKNGEALALRFADTEIFPRQIGLRRLRQLASQHGQTMALRSPQKITAGLFAAIYQEGHRTR